MNIYGNIACFQRNEIWVLCPSSIVLLDFFNITFTDQDHFCTFEKARLYK